MDVEGTGKWMAYQSFDIKPDTVLNHEFPEGFSAYWVRAISEQPATVTVVFKYE